MSKTSTKRSAEQRKAQAQALHASILDQVQQLSQVDSGAGFSTSPAPSTATA